MMWKFARMMIVGEADLTGLTMMAETEKKRIRATTPMAAILPEEAQKTTAAMMTAAMKRSLSTVLKSRRLMRRNPVKLMNY